eukprot:Rhum_TRINITY_DN12694_c0_g1::Rhum_TRINITY_DN12694_c0_g1_i1::g.53692::m.53692
MAEDVPTVKTGFFAPPPVAAEAPQLALDIEEEEEGRRQPLSRAHSEILGLCEYDVATMTSDELVIHVEKLIRQRRATASSGTDAITSLKTGLDGEEGGEWGAAGAGGGGGGARIDPADLPPLPPLPTPKVPTLVNGLVLK